MSKEKNEKKEGNGKCGCSCCKKGEGKRHGMNHYKGKK